MNAMPFRQKRSRGNIDLLVMPKYCFDVLQKCICCRFCGMVNRKSAQLSWLQLQTFSFCYRVFPQFF